MSEESILKTIHLIVGSINSPKGGRMFPREKLESLLQKALAKNDHSVFDFVTINSPEIFTHETLQHYVLNYMERISTQDPSRCADLIRNILYYSPLEIEKMNQGKLQSIIVKNEDFMAIALVSNGTPAGITLNIITMMKLTDPATPFSATESERRHPLLVKTIKEATSSENRLSNPAFVGSMMRSNKKAFILSMLKIPMQKTSLEVNKVFTEGIPERNSPNGPPDLSEEGSLVSGKRRLEESRKKFFSEECDENSAVELTSIISQADNQYIISEALQQQKNNPEYLFKAIGVSGTSMNPIGRIIMHYFDNAVKKISDELLKFPAGLRILSSSEKVSPLFWSNLFDAYAEKDAQMNVLVDNVVCPNLLINVQECLFMLRISILEKIIIRLLNEKYDWTIMTMKQTESIEGFIKKIFEKSSNEITTQISVLLMRKISSLSYELAQAVIGKIFEKKETLKKFIEEVPINEILKLSFTPEQLEILSKTYDQVKGKEEEVGYEDIDDWFSKFSKQNKRQLSKTAFISLPIDKEEMEKEAWMKELLLGSFLGISSTWITGPAEIKLIKHLMDRDDNLEQTVIEEINSVSSVPVNTLEEAMRLSKKDIDLAKQKISQSPRVKKIKEEITKMKKEKPQEQIGATLPKEIPYKDYVSTIIETLSKDKKHKNLSQKDLEKIAKETFDNIKNKELNHIETNVLAKSSSDFSSIAQRYQVQQSLTNDFQIISDVAKSKGLTPVQTKMLFSVRIIENGRRGCEFGVADYDINSSARKFAPERVGIDMNEIGWEKEWDQKYRESSLREQAEWAAETIKKRLQWDENGNPLVARFAFRWCPENWENWTNMIKKLILS